MRDWSADCKGMVFFNSNFGLYYLSPPVGHSGYGCPLNPERGIHAGLTLIREGRFVVQSLPELVAILLGLLLVPGNRRVHFF